MHTPITDPMMTESLRLRELIIPMIEFSAGTCAASVTPSVREQTDRKRAAATNPRRRACALECLSAQLVVRRTRLVLRRLGCEGTK